MAIGIIYCSIIAVSDIQTDKINMCGRNRDRYKMKTFYKVSDFNDRFDRITSYFLPFSFKNVVLFCLSWMGGQMGEQMEIKATLALFCLHHYPSSILSILYLYLAYLYHHRVIVYLSRRSGVELSSAPLVTKKGDV